MTLREALEATVNLLGDIPVPRKYSQLIGEPIDAAIGNLTTCIEALDKEENDGNDHAE